MILTLARGANKKSYFAEELTREPNHYLKCCQSSQARTIARKEDTSTTTLLSLDQSR